METLNRFSGVLAVVAVVIAITVPFFLGGSNTFGATGTRFPNGLSTDSTSPSAGQMRTTTLLTTSTATIGSSGTALSQVLSGSCNLLQSQAGSHAATTSKEYFCAVTGVTAGDTVIVSLPVGAGENLNGAGSIYGGFAVGSAYATSSNRIAVGLVNRTGAATSSFPQATTSAEYLIIR